MYQIAVSGAAKGESVAEGRELALKLGAALARHGQVLLTGATVGLPNYASIGYKKAGGVMSLGISPASSKIEHIMKYHLPVDSYDTILYSGLHYVGRDNLLITSADAVISIGGRLGTLHEFTISMEAGIPIAFLQGAGGISQEINTLLDLAQPLKKGSHVLFNDDPDNLITELVALLDEINLKYKDIYN